MLRVGEVAMGGERGREPADLPSAHGVRLPGEAQRTRAGPADLAGGEVQADQRRVLVGAACRLVEALAVEGERGTLVIPVQTGIQTWIPASAGMTSREPPCRRDDVFRAHAADLAGDARG